MWDHVIVQDSQKGSIICGAKRFHMELCRDIVCESVRLHCSRRCFSFLEDMQFKAKPLNRETRWYFACRAPIIQAGVSPPTCGVQTRKILTFPLSNCEHQQQHWNIIHVTRDLGSGVASILQTQPLSLGLLKVTFQIVQIQFLGWRSKHAAVY